VRRAAAALLLALAACGGGSGQPGEAGGTGGGTPSRTFGDTRATRTPTRGVTTTPPPAGESPTAAQTTTPPAEPGATYDLSAQGRTDCSYVPGGTVDGRDALNVGFHLVLIGSSGLDRLVEVVGRSDTGLSARVAAQANNRGQTILAFPLRGEDFGRTHRIELTVDPDNQFRETDESNNVLALSVTLPSPRPSHAMDLACS